MSTTDRHSTDIAQTYYGHSTDIVQTKQDQDQGKTKTNAGPRPRQDRTKTKSRQNQGHFLARRIYACNEIVFWRPHIAATNDFSKLFEKILIYDIDYEL